MKRSTGYRTTEVSMSQSTRVDKAGAQNWGSMHCRGLRPELTEAGVGTERLLRRAQRANLKVAGAR